MRNRGLGSGDPVPVAFCRGVASWQDGGFGIHSSRKMRHIQHNTAKSSRPKELRPNAHSAQETSNKNVFHKLTLGPGPQFVRCRLKQRIQARTARLGRPRCTLGDDYSRRRPNCLLLVHSTTIEERKFGICADEHDKSTVVQLGPFTTALIRQALQGLSKR